MTDQPHTHHHTHPPIFRFTFRARIALLALALIANILILAQITDVVAGVIVFALSVILYTFLTLRFWKCPHCGKYPGNAVMPDYCEKCGKAIFGVDAHLPTLKTGTLRTPFVRLRYIILGRSVYGIMLLAYFVIFAPEQSSSPAVFWLGALVFIGFGAWFEWRWWRCPSCGGYLRRSLWPGKSCMKCGEKLRY